MEPIRTFQQLSTHLKMHASRKRVAVVCGYDDHSFGAIERALHDGLAEFILVGEAEKYTRYFQLEGAEQYITTAEVTGCDEAARMGVSLVREGKADILMKGIINTDNLLHAILNKEEGLLPHGKVLTHIAVMQIPTYPKLLFFSDAAVIPNPTLEQRMVIVDDAIHVCHRFGIAEPRVALVHCTEKINPKFPISVDIAEMVKRHKEGAFPHAIVDGSIDVRVACDKASMEIKNIHSPINGEADMLLFPDIEAGNAFYKAVTLFAHAEMAGLLMGPQCPVVLTSRSDSAQTKFYSLSMACLL
jgi:phosphate butyryltransferase